MYNFENIWENILSREEDVIKLTFKDLSEEEKGYILGHLNKMVSEDGWQPEQIASASFALEVLSRGKTK